MSILYNGCTLIVFGANGEPDRLATVVDGEVVFVSETPALADFLAAVASLRPRRKVGPIEWLPDDPETKGETK